MKPLTILLSILLLVTSMLQSQTLSKTQRKEIYLITTVSETAIETAIEKSIVPSYYKDTPLNYVFKYYNLDENKLAAILLEGQSESWVGYVSKPLIYLYADKINTCHRPLTITESRTILGFTSYENWSISTLTSAIQNNFPQDEFFQMMLIIATKSHNLSYQDARNLTNCLADILGNYILAQVILSNDMTRNAFNSIVNESVTEACYVLIGCLKNDQNILKSTLESNLSYSAQNRSIGSGLLLLIIGDHYSLTKMSSAALIRNDSAGIFLTLCSIFLESRLNSE